MTKQEITEFALTISGASADCPFEDDLDTTVLRHSDSRKWFGIIMNRGEDIGYILNLKCEPEHSDFLKAQFEGITEAWHMNKRLWITVYPESDVPRDEIERLILASFELTSKKSKKKSRSDKK